MANSAWHFDVNGTEFLFANIRTSLRANTFSIALSLFSCNTNQRTQRTQHAIVATNFNESVWDKIYKISYDLS